LRVEEEKIEDLTKDQRTVFVSQLVMKADERAVRKFFEKVGKVKQVIMIRDKYTNRHKGFAYVEMKKLDAIPLVLMLNNLVPDFQKFPILIKASEAEKNFIAKEDAAAGIKKGHDGMPISNPGVKDKVYVGNLPPQIGEEDLKTVLAAFGPIDSAKVHRDESTGASKGFAFVKFSNETDAANCVLKMEMEGLELMGRVLRVSFAHDPNSAAAAYSGGAPAAGPGGAKPLDWRLDEMAGAHGRDGEGLPHGETQLVGRRQRAAWHAPSPHDELVWATGPTFGGCCHGGRHGAGAVQLACVDDQPGCGRWAPSGSRRAAAAADDDGAPSCRCCCDAGRGFAPRGEPELLRAHQEHVRPGHGDGGGLGRGHQGGHGGGVLQVRGGAALLR